MDDPLHAGEPAPLLPDKRGELPSIRLASEHSSLEVVAQGAHVIDWTIPGAPPVLFLSPASGFIPGKAIRGGVPLIFPWFGPKPGDSRAAQHGFVRARDWVLESESIDEEGTCKVALTLADDAQSLAAWPHAFSARFVAIAGRQLRLALEIRNSGASPFTFEAALHTYLAVSDVRRIRLRGLENTEYLDKVDGGAKRREGAAPIALSGETDRIYLATSSPCSVDDPDWNRRIVIAKSGSCSTVVWNPWLEKARAMGDLGESNWSGMVCVETANAAEDARTLAPGESHVLEAVITVSHRTNPSD